MIIDILNWKTLTTLIKATAAVSHLVHGQVQVNATTSNIKMAILVVSCYRRTFHALTNIRHNWIDEM